MKDPGFDVHEPVAEFRGARDYVHSTDLYDEIVRGAEALGLNFAGPVDLRIKARITRQPRYRFSREDALSPVADAVAAQCRFHDGGRPWVVLVSEGVTPVIGRKPYDEGPAARHGSITGRTARLTGETGLQPIEAVTALAVLLHKTALPPPPGRRWMLGQMTLERALAPRDATELRIEIDKVSAGAITRSTLFSGDERLGALVFILADG